MAVTYAPFSGVTDLTEIVSANAQTEINGEIDKVIALFQRTDGQSQPHPDFDLIQPATADKIVAELEALKTAVDAAPTE